MAGQGRQTYTAMYIHPCLQYVTMYFTYAYICICLFIYLYVYEHTVHMTIILHNIAIRYTVCMYIPINLFMHVGIYAHYVI